MRPDRQEDVSFALYRLSSGSSRKTALVRELVLPGPDDRVVHGNAAFTGDYFLRAASAAADADAGLVLLHSHPTGRGWQGMSPDDIAAEHGHAAQALALTELPLVGMTLGTEEMSWSARTWELAKDGAYQRHDCQSVRVVGDQLCVRFNPALSPEPAATDAQHRTVSAWGPETQSVLARLRIGVVGAGSVGSIVAETLARTGVQHIVLIDFDSVETLNLDRLLHATKRDVRLARSKVETLRRGLLQSATARQPRVDAVELSVVEPDGYLAALDCDVLFSCVDRPWGRSALNFIAYAHLIPVIDGGIRVRSNGRQLLGADWKAHTAAPGRPCLECLQQYDPGLVSAERDGYLDDPRYIEGVPAGHPLKSNENVFAFSAHAAAMETIQMLSMVVAPSGIADIGTHSYHFVPGEPAYEFTSCSDNCLYSNDLLAVGSTSGITVTGHHQVAEAERTERARRQRPARVKLGRTVDRLVDRLRDA